VGGLNGGGQRALATLLHVTEPAGQIFVSYRPTIAHGTVAPYLPPRHTRIYHGQRWTTTFTGQHARSYSWLHTQLQQKNPHSPCTRWLADRLYRPVVRSRLDVYTVLHHTTPQLVVAFTPALPYSCRGRSTHRLLVRGYLTTFYGYGSDTATYLPAGPCDCHTYLTSTYQLGGLVRIPLLPPRSPSPLLPTVPVGYGYGTPAYTG